MTQKCFKKLDPGFAISVIQVKLSNNTFFNNDFKIPLISNEANKLLIKSTKLKQSFLTPESSFSGNTLFVRAIFLPFKSENVLLVLL